VLFRILVILRQYDSDEHEDCRRRNHRTWYGHGMDMVWTWYGHGTDMVRTWCDLLLSESGFSVFKDSRDSPLSIAN
jgi:hypothetical protein